MRLFVTLTYRASTKGDPRDVLACLNRFSGFRVVDAQEQASIGSYGTKTAVPLNSPLRRSVSALFACSSG